MRRIRVARWSSLKRFSSWSGSASLFSRSVIRVSWPLDQRLVAAREVGEDRVDVAPQQGLLGGEPDGLAVDLVEGAGDLADLVRGVDRDRRDPGVDPARVGPRELVDQHRQPLLGDAEGGGAQPAHAGLIGRATSAARMKATSRAASTSAALMKASLLASSAMSVGVRERGCR